MKTTVALMAALCVGGAVVSPAMQDPDPLAVGIRQVEGGEFDAAVITLDRAARTLAAQGNRLKDLARAYTYLAIAYLELGQEPAAREKVLEALRTDRELRLDERQFPPKFVRFFEQVRGTTVVAATPPAVAATPAPSPRPSPSAPAAATAPAAAKKGGSKTLPILLGVGAAAGVGVALAAGGGGDDGGGSTTPVSIPPLPTPLSSLSASVTSPQRSANLNCTENVTAVVTLTNRGSSSVSVTGVRSESRVVSGGCFAGQPFTFLPSANLVGSNQTVTVLNNMLFSTGAGCCSAGNRCDGTSFCEFTALLTVITSIGEVPAGGFNYGVRFERCVPCASVRGTATNCSEAVQEQ